jgi:chitodextrinase
MADFVLGRLRFHFKGDWVTATAYIKDDCVRYGGNVFVVKSNHTSNADFYVDLTASKLEKFTGGHEFKNTWATTTYYKVDDVVQWGGKTYIANLGHTSAASLYDDEAKWTEFTSGFAWLGTYTNATDYKLNDVVKYGASTYVCTTQHTAGSTLDGTKFTLFASGLEFEDSWVIGTNYQLGDITTYGGYSYVAARDNIGVVPYNNTLDWSILSTGFKQKGQYNNATAYSPGDVVIYGGHSFSAKVDTTGNAPDSATHWELVVEGLTWKDAWTDATVYSPGDTLGHIANAYRCKLTHTSNNGVNDPVTDSAGTYWDLVAEGDSAAVMSAQGDLLTRNPTANYRLPIGAAGSYLRSDGADPSWETGPIGVADGGTGLSTVAVDTLVTGNTAGALTSEAKLKFVDIGSGAMQLQVTGGVDIQGALTTVCYDVSGDTVLATARITDLTDGRVVISGALGEIEDDANFTWNKSTSLLSATKISIGTSAVIASASVADLTDGRVVVAGASGELEDHAAFTYNGTTLAVDSLDVDNIKINGNVISSTDVNGNITFTPNGTGGLIFSTVATQSTAPSIGTHVTNKDYVDEQAAPATTALQINQTTGALTHIVSTNFNVPAQVADFGQDPANSVWFAAGEGATLEIDAKGHLQLNVA